ncbi:unnamed protein product, partial [Laminaria digitata]
YGFLPPSLVRRRNEAFRLKQWSKWMKNPGQAECLYVIRSGETGIGFCFAKPCDDVDAPRGAGELHAGYVLPQWRGSSAGPKLMLTMARFLEDNQKAPLVIWVFRQNPMRIWYAQLGWRKFIERTRTLDGTDITEFGYISPPLGKLYKRLETMIENCDGRAVAPRRRRPSRLSHPPHLAESGTIPETGLQTL